MLDPTIPLKIVSSYSHVDREYLGKFDKFWQPLRAESAVVSWTDRGILAGQVWDDLIKKAFQEADVYLFLLSADALASEYINTVEIKIATERSATGSAAIIPIIVRPCLWQYTAFKHLQALPSGGKAISTWANEDEALLDVAGGLIQRLIDIQQQRKAQGG
ncbi:MAG: toll/interleukin-1 receptor domain-containing protein [Saprospiraceae bacterium]|nr:toll/interleukin-1 receptor domain-containing protein [Saprospiraceae bacterium]